MRGGFFSSAVEELIIDFFWDDSVVCCVRFSADGKFLATGCNRTAQIYDTKTGLKTWLVRDSALF